MPTELRAGPASVQPDRGARLESRPGQPGCPDNAAFYTDFTVAYPAGVPPWVVPGTSWGPGVEYTYVEGMPAVHFFDQRPFSCSSLS